MAELAPDVIFAQKATALVKAASMDPRQMDLETFRKYACVVFTRAYCAIYKTTLVSDLDECSSKEEQILNAQLVIDGLYRHTGNSVLQTVSGMDIWQGNHKAIGMLVGVLFHEGQRMWKESQRPAPQTPTPSRPSPIRAPPSPSQSGGGGPQSPPGSPGNGTGELDKLLHRINYLETKLRRKKKPIRPQSAGGIRQTAGDIRQGAGENRKAAGEDGDEDSELSGSAGGAGDRGSGHVQQAGHIQQAGQPPTRRRPASSPGVRARNIAERLYSTALNRQAMEELIKHPPGGAAAAAGGAGGGGGPTVKVYVDDPLYTYDMKSGRRILKTDNEYQKEDARRRQQALHVLTTYDDDLMAGKPARRPVSPGRSEYPGKRIEKSVEDWLQKMRNAQMEDKSAPSGKSRGKNGRRPISPGKSAQTPKPSLIEPLAVHGGMEEMDLMLTVEHCHDCERHCVHTRHDSAEYLYQSDSMLVALSKELLSHNIPVRLSVCRIPHDGLGAFEVTIALKHSGQLQGELLHSKLSTGRWPAKSVLAKRIEAFCNRYKLHALGRGRGGYEDEEVNMVTHHGQSVPTGPRVSLLDTCMAEGWKGNGQTVTYVYDSRAVHHAASPAHGKEREKEREVSHVEVSPATSPASVSHSVREHHHEEEEEHEHVEAAASPLAAPTAAPMQADDEQTLVLLQAALSPHTAVLSTCAREMSLLALTDLLAPSTLTGQLMQCVSEQFRFIGDDGNEHKGVVDMDKLNAWLRGHGQQQLDEQALMQQLHAVLSRHIAVLSKHTGDMSLLALTDLLAAQGCQLTGELMQCVSRGFRYMDGDGNEHKGVLDMDKLNAWLAGHEQQQSTTEEVVVSDPVKVPDAGTPVSSAPEGVAVVPEPVTASEQQTPVRVPAPTTTEEVQVVPVPVPVNTVLPTDPSTTEEVEGDGYDESFLQMSADPAQLPAQTATVPLDTTPAVVAAEAPETPRDEAADQLTPLYQARDVIISSIVLEGSALMGSAYDEVYLVLDLPTHPPSSYTASTFLPREKGSKRRTFNLTWAEIFLSADQFRSTALLQVLVPTVPSQGGDGSPRLSESPRAGRCVGKVAMALVGLMESSFEVKTAISLEDNEVIDAILHGHAHEAREARTTRILSMKPTDLVNLRFDPLPVDDYASEEDEDDEQHAFAKSSPLATSSSLDLNSSLFPKPSMTDLLAAV